MNLKKATVTGFFSLPSASLAEHNPSAYNMAMAAAPVGAGTCAHCGTGIRHHVVVEVDGVQAFIGTDCAIRIGGDAARAATSRLTTAQLEAKRQYHEAQSAAWDEEQLRREAAKRQREERFADVMLVLRNQASGFHASLADQLTNRPLSPKQAQWVCKAVFGRYSKKVAAAWEELDANLTSE